MGADREPAGRLLYGDGALMHTKRLRLKGLGDGVVTAVFATLNVKDHDGDVTLPGAFGDQEAPILPTHDRSAMPLGKAIIREEKAEAIAELHFNLDTAAGRDWFSALKFDFENGTPRQEYSYGFDVLEREGGMFNGEPVQLLKKLKVHEVSPVLLGAGISTRTVAVKAGADDRDGDELAKSQLLAMTLALHRNSSDLDLEAESPRVG